MKGVVFTEFLEMVESAHGYEMVDHLLETCDLPSGGSYTAVGAYDHGELVTMVVELSSKTGAAVPDLVQAFGRYLFGTFTRAYPQFFPDDLKAFDFLAGIEDHIHVEVRKLYPDAELPTFGIERPDDETLIMDYHSSRHFEDLAEGLIKQCLDHFGETASVSRAEIEGTDDTRFTIVKS